MTASTETPARQHDPTSGQAVLEAKDVAVHFGGVKAVDGISMTLMPGLIYGIIGPNGSGKSTLIGAVTRLTKLTSGKLLFDGEEYQGIPASAVARKRVARTFQTVRLLPDLNVKDNIQLGADARADGDGQPLVKRLLNRTTSPVVADVIERTNLPIEYVGVGCSRQQISITIACQGSNRIFHGVGIQVAQNQVIGIVRFGWFCS